MFIIIMLTDFYIMLSPFLEGIQSLCIVEAYKYTVTFHVNNETEIHRPYIIICSQEIMNHVNFVL